MRTNIDIDDDLMAEAMEATGAKTKKAVVEAGLEALIQRRRQARILELQGTVQWEGDLDEMRQGRVFDE